LRESLRTGTFADGRSYPIKISQSTYGDKRNVADMRLRQVGVLEAQALCFGSKASSHCLTVSHPSLFYGGCGRPYLGYRPPGSCEEIGGNAPVKGLSVKQCGSAPSAWHVRPGANRWAS